MGDEYEFYRNGTLLGSRQTSNIFSTTNLGDNDYVNVIAYFTNGCGRTSNNIFFSIDAIPTTTLSSDAPNDTVCEGGDVNFTVTGGGWHEFLVNGSSQGASSTSSSTLVSNITVDNTVVTVRSWLNNTATCYDEDSITIRLNSLSGLNQIANAQTICAGGDPAALSSNSILTADRAGATISYQWQSRTGANPFVDITGANTITYDPSTISTTTYYRRLIYSTFNGVQCPSSSPLAASNVITVTANPNSVAAIQTNAFNNTVCSGEDIILDASASVDAVSYLFYLNGAAQGSAQAAATRTLSAVDVSDNATITVIAYNASGCSTSATLNIRLNSFGGTNSISGSQSVCAGETPTILSNVSSSTVDRSADGAAVAYQWQSRQGANPFTDVLSANSLEFTPSAVSTTTDFRRLITSTYNGVTCTVTSNIVQLTVTGGSVPTASASSGNVNNVLCVGDDIIIDASGSSGASSYGFMLNGIMQSGTPTSTSSFTFASGTVNDNDDISVIAYSGTLGAGCTDTVTLTIRLNSITGTTTLSGAQTICSGDTPTQISGSLSTSVLGGTITYQWQSRVGTATFVNIGGANSPNYTPPSLANTTDFRRISTSTVSGSTCSVESSQIRITTTAAPTASLAGGATPVCSGDQVVFTASGGTFYEFFVNNVSMGASSTSDTISSTTLTDGEQITVRVTNAQGCSALSTPTTVSVSTMPSAGISSGYLANTICEGEFPVFSATPAAAGNSYRFYIDGILQNLGVSTNTFDSSAATYTILDSSQILVIVENTAGCTSSSTLTMRVLSTTGANSISGSQTICVGGDPNAFTSNAVPSPVAVGSTISYQWQSRTVSGSFADIPGATALTFDAAPLSATTAFRRLVYVTLGGTTCPVPSNLASATSNVVTITVDPSALPVISFVSGATNDIVCAGDDLTFDASGTTGANSYEYFINNISQGPSSVATTLFVPSGTISDSTLIRVHATSSSASPCFSAFTITMRLNSFSGTNAIGNGQNICENDDPAILSSISVPTADIAGATLSYVWQSRTGANPFVPITGANSITFDPSLLATTTDFRRVARSDFNGVQCIDVSNFVTIAVDPLPLATLTGTSTACLGEAVQFTASGGVSYEFMRNGITFVGPSASNVATTTTNNGDQITVAVTNTDSCTAVSAPIVMSVSNPPAAALSSGLTAETMCEGDFPIFTASPGSAGLTYTFYVNGGIQTTGVTTNSFNTQLAGVNLTDGSIVLVEISNADGCTGSASLTIRVNGLTGANTITGSQTICSGGDPTILNDFSTPTANLAADGATLSYQWQSRTAGNAICRYSWRNSHYV